MNLGAALVNMARYEEAAEKLKKAEALIAKEPERNTGTRSNIYRVLGELHYKQGEDEIALDNFLAAAEVSDFVTLKILALTELATFLTVRQRPARALALASVIQAQPNISSLELQRAVEIAETTEADLAPEVAADLKAWGSGISLDKVIAAIAASKDAWLSQTREGLFPIAPDP